MNRFLTLALLILAPAAFAQTASISTADSMTRIGPTATPPVTTSISLTAARGEIVSAQINVAASGGAVTVTNLSCPTFSGPGATIPASACSFFREYYTTVTGTANYGGGSNAPLGSGTYPEPLIPFNDPETGTALGTGNAINAASFSVASGQNQPYWVDINVPRGTISTPPGTYSGNISVVTSVGTKTVPVSITVPNMEISVKVNQPSEVSQWAPCCGLTVAAMAQAAMRNRLFNWYVDAGSAAGYQSTYGITRSGLDAYQFVESSSCGTYPSVPSSATITGYAANFPSTLNLDFYVGDELNGCTGAVSFLQAISNAAHGATPPVKTIATWNNVTSAPQSSLQGYIDHWALLISQEQWPTLPYTGQGDLWSYSSCNTGNGNTPQWLIDYPVIDERLQAGFLGIQQGQSGILYTRLDGWNSGNAIGSYANLNKSDCGTGSGPGDAMLLYPPGPIGSSEPAPGIRIKNLRDGEQDYEISKQLIALGGSSFLNAQLGAVGSSWTSFTSTPSVLISAHNNIEAQIGALNTPAGPAPVVYFTDLTSGPNTGGENGNGTILTIYGRNFGATQGVSTVTVGGGTVAAYKVWDGRSNAGSAQAQLETISVAIGSSAATGTVVVHTSAGASTCENTKDNCLFTVRSGNLRCVATTGNDANAGTFPSLCWKTIVNAKNTIVGGDIAYIENGVSQTAVDDYNAALAIISNNCASATPCALVAYPGATATVGTTTSSYGTRTPAVAGSKDYWVMAGLTFQGDAGMDLLDVTGWRVINNIFNCPNGSGQSACMHTDTTVQYSFYGNYTHNVGNTAGSIDKFYHGNYFTTNTNHVWYGWNEVDNNPGGSTTQGGCRAVQFFSTGGADQFDLHIHDNYIHDSICDGLNFATVNPGSGTVEAYNNVIFHVGTGPDPGNGASDYACLVAGGGGTVAVNFYNNTLYDCGGRKAADSGTIYVARAVTMYNNANQQLSGEIYLTSSSSAGSLSGSNNIWNGGGTAPTQTTGNITSAPQFTTPGSNFTLLGTSPAIGAGSAAHDSPWDFLGLVRPSPPAIGAYELQGATQINTGVPVAPLLTLKAQ